MFLGIFANNANKAGSSITKKDVLFYQIIVRRLIKMGPVKHAEINITLAIQENAREFFKTANKWDLGISVRYVMMASIWILMVDVKFYLKVVRVLYHLVFVVYVMKVTLQHFKVNVLWSSKTAKIQMGTSVLNA